MAQTTIGEKRGDDDAAADGSCGTGALLGGPLPPAIRAPSGRVFDRGAAELGLRFGDSSDGS